MKSPRLPSLFIGHGSPMNAIADNEFTEMLKKLGGELPKPEAVLCISAHWLTKGTWITHMKQPRTIHDFHGFPQPLFDIQYPSPGSPEIAELVSRLVEKPQVILDDETWGLDHGTWSVLRHLYPKADIPVLQMSINIEQPSSYHFELGKKLRVLRENGILVLGSGNIVHNLRQIKWEADAEPFDWAEAFDQWAKEKLLERDFDSLVSKASLSPAGKLSIPTPEHYYPLLYVLGSSDDKDDLRFEFEEIQNGSISMRSLSFGRKSK